MYVLKALGWWLRDDSPFRSILSEIIETLLWRGVNPNWVYGKHSLWTFFTGCLYSDSTWGIFYSDHSEECAIRVVKAFYSRGASPSQIVMREAMDKKNIDAGTIQSVPDVKSIQYEKTGDDQPVLSAHAAIKRMISAKGMQELELAGKKIVPMPTVGKHGTDMS